MSGFEIGALIAGTIGAAASSVSAYKDAKEKRSGAVYRSTETVQVGLPRISQKGCDLTRPKYGNVIQQTQKICATSGGGDAGIKSNGDMYAGSTTGGSATAVYSVDKQSWNSTQWKSRK